MKNLPERICCDLCDQYEEIAWTYVTPNVVDTQAEAQATNKFWAEDPEWAVCQACHEIIESGNLESLIAYSLHRQVSIAPFATKQGVKAMEREIRRIHTLFWKHKSDECFPEPGHNLPLPAQDEEG